MRRLPDNLVVYLQGNGDTDGDLYIAPGQKNKEPPVFIAKRRVTAFTRGIIERSFAGAFEALAPKKIAALCARETLRLMEEDATEKNGMVIMVYTPQVSNLAWMKAGIDPVLGDLIARQKIAERSWATEQEPG